VSKPAHAVGGGVAAVSMSTGVAFVLRSLSNTASRRAGPGASLRTMASSSASCALIQERPRRYRRSRHSLSLRNALEKGCANRPRFIFDNEDSHGTNWGHACQQHDPGGIKLGSKRGREAENKFLPGKKPLPSYCQFNFKRGRLAPRFVNEQTLGESRSSPQHSRSKSRSTGPLHARHSPAIEPGSS